MSRRVKPRVQVVIWEMQDRRPRGANKPWVVRWRVGTNKFSRAFATRRQALSFEAALRVAIEDGVRFDHSLGLPVDQIVSTQTAAELVQSFLTEERWSKWSPRTRRGHIEASARWVRIMVRPNAPALPDSVARQLDEWLRPDVSGDFRDIEKWLGRWSLPLDEFTNVNVAAAVGLLGRKLDGTRAGEAMASRMRRTVRVHISHATRLGLLPADIWPKQEPKTKGDFRASDGIDSSRLPTADQVRELLDATLNHRPESHGYRVLTACVFYAGLRPSEARALRVEHLTLPENGWGEIFVTKAVQDDGTKWGTEDERIGYTKTGRDRAVPIPPPLVAILRSYVGSRTEGLLVSTRFGNPVTMSNWSRNWVRTRKTQGLTCTLYELRHVNATLLVNAGVSLAEAASRLGHSVDTLVRYYVASSTNDTDRGNEILDAAGVW